MAQTLTQTDLIRLLLSHRAGISASIWLVLRDVHLTEDVFQEVMIKALDHQDIFTNESQLLSWCRVTARNAALNLVRGRGRETFVLSADILELVDVEWVAAPRTTAERIEALEDCVAALPESSRELLEARYYHGKSCLEVARAVGVNLQTIYQRLSRLHRAMRDCVERRLRSGLPDRAEGAS
jgi:RNA polymerase sigma-70 factor (ECF subfamily)